MCPWKCNLLTILKKFHSFLIFMGLIFLLRFFIDKTIYDIKIVEIWRKYANGSVFIFYCPLISLPKSISSIGCFKPTQYRVSNMHIHESQNHYYYSLKNQRWESNHLLMKYYIFPLAVLTCFIFCISYNFSLIIIYIDVVLCGIFFFETTTKFDCIINQIKYRCFWGMIVDVMHMYLLLRHNYEFSYVCQSYSILY